MNDRELNEAVQKFLNGRVLTEAESVALIELHENLIYWLGCFGARYKNTLTQVSEDKMLVEQQMLAGERHHAKILVA